MNAAARPHINPTLEWYVAISKRKGLPPRCPFASVHRCPRYYQSLALMGNAGGTKIDPEEDKKLLDKWEKSDLWPAVMEHMSGVMLIGGDPRSFNNFCPEVMYDFFDYFASYLSRYSDEIDIGLAHERLGRQGIGGEDYRWAWRTAISMHYTECPLYSPLLHRGNVPISEVQGGQKRPMFEEGIEINLGIVKFKVYPGSILRKILPKSQGK